MATMADRLRMMKALRTGSTIPTSQQTTSGPTLYAGEIPGIRYQALNTTEADDELIRKLKAYLETPVVIPPPDPSFMVLEGISIEERPEKLEFPDNTLMRKPGISMGRFADSFIAELGRFVIPMVYSGFSRQGAAVVFILAYHLKRPGSNFGPSYMFENISSLEDMTDRDYTDFSEIVNGSPLTPLMASNNVKKEAATYSFLAASLLRLFTRSTENLVTNWQKLQEGFKNFYKEPIDISIPVATASAISGLKDWFALEPRAKIALYRLMYVGNESNEDYNMRRFLYDMHLMNTGLHIISMFIQICTLANADTVTVLNLLNDAPNRKAVKGISRAIYLMGTTDERYKRGIWRYGRIFDDTFLSSIRTKNCPKLVYMMGTILKREAPLGNENILQIVQLANLGEQVKIRCEFAGVELMKILRKQVQTNLVE